MSRAFNGGRDTYNEERPTNDTDSIQLLQRFIRDHFRAGDDVAKEIGTEDDKILLFFADDDEQESPATWKQNGDLIAYGSLTYRAEDHGVQTIWENQFELRETDDGILVRISNWYGTTVESWHKKLDRQTLYLP